MECTKREREKNVISNVIPFTKEQMVFVCGASRKFYTLKLLLYSRLPKRNAIVEHPRLCHSWCQHALSQQRCGVTLTHCHCICIMWIVPKCRQELLAWSLFCAVISQGWYWLNEVTLNDLEFLHLYSCLLWLDSSSLQTSGFGSWWGTVPWWHKSAPSAPLDCSTVGSLQSIWCFIGSKFDPKSPGKNSRQMINFPICLLIWNLKSTGRANHEKKWTC